MLVSLLSRPEGWNVNIQSFVRQHVGGLKPSKTGYDKAARIFNDLRYRKYIWRLKEKGSKGQFTGITDCCVYCEPTDYEQVQKDIASMGAGRLLVIEDPYNLSQQSQNPEKPDFGESGTTNVIDIHSLSITTKNGLEKQRITNKEGLACVATAPEYQQEGGSKSNSKSDTGKHEPDALFHKLDAAYCDDITINLSDGELHDTRNNILRSYECRVGAYASNDRNQRILNRAALRCLAEAYMRAIAVANVIDKFIEILADWYNRKQPIPQPGHLLSIGLWQQLCKYFDAIGLDEMPVEYRG